MSQSTFNVNNDGGLATADDDTDAASPTTSVEINFRLDENGRTAFDPSLRRFSHASAAVGVVDKYDFAVDSGGGLATIDETNCINDLNEPNAKRARIEHTHDKDIMGVDYSTKTVMTNLTNINSKVFKEEMIDSLLFDCEITDCGLMPRTFWIPAQGMEPRCFLEKLALQIFHHHVPPISNNFYYDPSTSGAEWWVQLRPSPPGTGRYSMLFPDKNPDDMAKSGMSFHWDKDEDLRLLCGGSLHVHPHLSSVTYFTDLGAPTMVLSKRVEGMTGEIIVEKVEEDTTGFVSWPKRGKHLSFDGRCLHAAPSDLMEDGLFEKQCQFEMSAKTTSEKEKKIMERRHRRTTFLVNLWLNYKPFNVHPFPETMIGSMSKADLFGDFDLFGRSEGDNVDTNDAQSSTHTKVCMTNSGATEIGGESKKSTQVVEMTWPMNSCNDNDHIKVPIPMEVIRERASDGSNVILSWEANMIQLSSQNEN